jgi:hypothetical protein
MTGESALERKMIIGRKLDMVYFSQSSECGPCECGRFEDQIKQLYDGAKVSKDMLVDLCRKAPDSIRAPSIIGFLLFGKYKLFFC